MGKTRLLILIEATTLTGPAKNLLNFLRLIRSEEFQDHDAQPQLDYSIVTFHRSAIPESAGDRQPENAFIGAARDQGIEVDVIFERFAFDIAVVDQLAK